MKWEKEVHLESKNKRSQEKRLQKWKEYFKNLLGNPLEITDKLTKKNYWWATKHQTRTVYGRRIRCCTEKKKKKKKAAGLDKTPLEVWKTRKFDDILLRLCNAVCKQSTIEKWTKAFILPFFKKSDFGITKNYRDITLTAIAAKIYNALLLNHIWLVMEKILRKNQNSF